MLEYYNTKQMEKPAILEQNDAIENGFIKMLTDFFEGVTFKFNHDYVVICMIVEDSSQDG